VQFAYEVEERRVFDRWIQGSPEAKFFDEALRGPLWDSGSSTHAPGQLSVEPATPIANPLIHTPNTGLFFLSYCKLWAHVYIEGHAGRAECDLSIPSAVDCTQVRVP
jgi:hypothetical protein